MQIDQQRFQYTLIDLIPASIYWKDLNGKYLGCNQYVVEMAGKTSRDEIIGKTDYELPWKDFADELKKLDQLVVHNIYPQEFEEYPTLANGEKKVFLTRKSPLFDDNHVIIGLIGISIDISHKKEAERLKFEKQKAVLQEKERYADLMQTLSGSVAHEIRNPLNSLSLCLDNFQEFVSDNHPKIEAFFEKMKIIVMGMSTITDLILNNLKVSTSQKIDKRYFKSCSIANDITESLKEYFFKEPEEKKLIHWHKMGKDFFYTGDTLLTKHMIFNLLKNALWAIKEADKGTIWISINTQPKKWNELIFKDTALGISPDIQQKLFTQFHSRKSTGDGTGLGLTFCRLVMQAYGGTIKCRSEQGKYTEFILRFPKFL